MAQKRSGIKWRNIILFLVVMVGLLVAAQRFFQPNMLGWNIDRVRLYENGNDIVIVYNYQFSETEPYGIVMDQINCERQEDCDVILTVSIGRDVSGSSEEEILAYIGELVEGGYISEEDIRENAPEHSNDVNAGYAILYDPRPSEGIVEVTFSLGPQVTIMEASMVAVGDVLLHDTVWEAYETTEEQAEQEEEEVLRTFDFSSLLADMAPFIQGADFAFANQESNIGGSLLGLSSYPNFNSPYEIARDLVKAGFNMFSRANNHTLDLGPEGVLAAQENWDRLGDGFITSGSAASQTQRNRIPVIEQNGIRIALLAYTYGFNGHQLPEDREYLANLFDEEQVKADIQRAKAQADLIAVAMHWGDEYVTIPNQAQLNRAQWLADQGVHLILGSHPHVVQPVEVITGEQGQETLVAYSLGNFISAQEGLEKNIGVVLSFDIQKVTIRDESRIEFKNIEMMPTHNFYDEEAGTYRLIPLADSDEVDYFETFEAAFERSRVTVVERGRYVEIEENTEPASEDEADDGQ